MPIRISYVCHRCYVLNFDTGCMQSYANFLWHSAHQCHLSAVLQNVALGKQAPHTLIMMKGLSRRVLRRQLVVQTHGQAFIVRKLAFLQQHAPS